MSLSEVLDQLIQVAVIVEEADDGRLKLRALSDDRPLSAETRELCRHHKETLLAYARFSREADQLLIGSTARIRSEWPDGCDALDNDLAWDDLEDQLRQAYWSMDRDRLRDVIDERQRYALTAMASSRLRQTRSEAAS